ncbi:MAG: DUF1614 domain-containing protein [Peptococcaceae bacterium]|nr:DUF1614 domain-containing protein [Peptococcaceae bacterium]
MGFYAGRLILVGLTLLIFFGLAERVLDRMHLTDKQAIIIVIAIFIGSFFNVNLYQSSELTIRLNLGGALLPLALALYVWLQAGTMKEKMRSLFGAVLTSALIIGIGWFFRNDEYALPIDMLYLYPIIAGLIGYLFGRSRKGAFVAAVLGVLFTDIAHGIYLIWTNTPGLVHFGGGGIFDSIVLAGVLAVCLAEFIGESRERIQGGPSSKNRDASVLKNLQAAGAKGDKKHG